jgi:hypothetical protein
MSFPAVSYTGAQFRRDMNSIPNQNVEQALKTLGDVGFKLSTQAVKRAMEYVVNGLNSGEILVAPGDELKAKHLEMLAPAAAISGTIQEPTGGSPALYLTLECELDVAWTISKGVELATKRTMASVTKVVKFAKAFPLGAVIGAGALYLMPYKAATAVAAGITYTAAQLTYIVD